MEQLRWQNAQKINFNRTVGAVNALSESEKRKRQDNMKDIKNLFKLRKEIDNSTIIGIINLFRLKKKTKQSKIK